MRTYRDSAKLVICAVASSVCTHRSTTAFTTAPLPPIRLPSTTTSPKTPPAPLSLPMSNKPDSNQYDLSKPTFDLFALRSVRNDALLQYSTLNQSEPLRINLYLLLTLTLLAFPTINETVGVVADGTNSLPTLALSALGGLASAFLFVRECGFRARQLTRMEKELNAESLLVKLPTTNKLDPRIFAGQPLVPLKQLRGEKKVLALRGPTGRLREALLDIRALRRRLAQANTVVVLLRTDVAAEEADDFDQLAVPEGEIRAAQWLALLQDKSAWLNYFNELTNEDGADNTNDIVWFGLNYSGRSFASGVGKPRMLEIMGQHLRPLELLDVNDASESTAGVDEDTKRVMEEVLARQQKFYNSLTTGDMDAMQEVLSANNSAEVTAVIDKGGRIDNWQSCLAEGARPSQMKTSGSDVLLVSPTEAYSTTIEFPATEVYGAAGGNELLAVQRWGRAKDGDAWKMEYHQTIPWTAGSKAGGTLRCDGRGCVALTSQTETRLSGRKIG